MDKGFIMLSRKFFSNEMWEAARTFSECEAWLDLIQSARFDATRLTASIGGREITYGRGQYPASIRFLSKRWRWGERKVRAFIEKLIKKGMVTTDNSQGMTVITLVKYDDYNINDTVKDTQNDTPNALDYNKIKEVVTQVVTQQMTQLRHSNDTKKNKGKKEKETLSNERVKKSEPDGSSLTPPAGTVERNLDECKADVLADQIWIETICMNEHLTPVMFTELIGDFFKTLQNRGDTFKSPRDAKSHFASWLNIQQRMKANEKNRANAQQCDRDPNEFLRNIAEGIARADYEESKR